MWFPYTIANTCGIFSCLLSYIISVTDFRERVKETHGNICEKMSLYLLAIVKTKEKQTNQNMPSYQTISRMGSLFIYLTVSYRWLMEVQHSAWQLTWFWLYCLMNVRVSWGSPTPGWVHMGSPDPHCRSVDSCLLPMYLILLWSAYQPEQALFTTMVKTQKTTQNHVRPLKTLIQKWHIWPLLH